MVAAADQSNDRDDECRDRDQVPQIRHAIPPLALDHTRLEHEEGPERGDGDSDDEAGDKCHTTL